MTEASVKFLTAKDKVIKKIVTEYGLPKIPTRPKGFATLVILILEQQVSVSSAKATFLKLKEYAGGIITTKLLALTDQEFRSCGVSRQKTVYIKELATAIITKRLQLTKIEKLEEPKIRAELIKIKGIGNWTIDVYCMMSLQLPDMFPIGDIAVVNTIKELYQLQTPEQMLELSKKWQPYRSMATFILWHYYLCKRNRTIEYSLS
jgi:DNA-3-methyladenine glycosylase II